MKLYNSLSNKIEKFEPYNSSDVKMYICGITPYDTTHLGHAFVYVTFDAFIRFLEFKGYKVTYTQNVTDIDNDILKRAKRDGKNWKELGDFWTNKFLKDLKSLNVKMPDHFIKATEAMPEIIEIIQKLQDLGFAYEKNGNVYPEQKQRASSAYFEVAKFPEYGKLSKYPSSVMAKLLKERGGDPGDPNKKAPLDFLLWQLSKPDEPYWESPWGKGRPGWHIECSGVIKKTLGDQIDFHGGGFDLIYPHHESEIAQSESASGKSPFVKYWMHIAMVYFKHEKMSKSLGNLVLVSDLLKKYSPNAIRLMLLQNHYRNLWEYTELHMQKAQEIMDNLEAKFRHTPLRWEAKPEGLNDLLLDLEDDFNTGKTLEKLIDESENQPARSKAGFELLGFKL